MAELRLKIPDELEKGIYERLAELKLERSKAFRKLLRSVFNRDSFGEISIKDNVFI